jgi:hypothetical protein
MPVHQSYFLVTDLVWDDDTVLKDIPKCVLLKADEAPFQPDFVN